MQRKDKPLVEKACRKYGYCIMDEEPLRVVYEAIARKDERKKWKKKLEAMEEELEDERRKIRSWCRTRQLVIK